MESSRSPQRYGEEDSLGTISFSLASDIVELVILTTDEAFMQTLRGAVTDSHRLWHVATADAISDLLIAGQVGIVVLDVMILREPASAFLSQIKRQFPDLIVVVAGKREAETALAGLISSGAVYRFIHKPMSPGRAKLFVDAAVKKYQEQRRRLRAPAIRRSGPRLWVAGAAAVLGLGVLLVSTWIPRRSPGSRDTAPQTVSRGGLPEAESPLLTRAAAALAANRLTQPGEDNALELYLQAVARNPASPAGRAGLTEVRERLSARVENALLEERLDKASTAIEAARNAGVDSGRIAFLTSQLVRARGRLKVATAQLLGADARTNITGARAERRNRLLELAAESIREDRLIEPDQDNARYYVQKALRVDPSDRTARAAQKTLAKALLADAQAAIGRRDFSRAVSMLDAADGIAAPSNVDRLAQTLRTARRQTETRMLGISN